MEHQVCGARNRRGEPCQRIPAPGKRRCHYHGGAPGSGAQPGNSNALKHGFYSRRIRELVLDVHEEDGHQLDLHTELALLRALLPRAIESESPATVALIVAQIARLVKLQRQFGAQPLGEQLATFLDQLADELGADTQGDSPS